MAADDKGILYVAIGPEMRKPLQKSIESVRQHLDLPITLITDLEDPPRVEQRISVEWPGRPGYPVKPAFIPRLPYHRTLYLDTDTVILRPDAAKPLDLITQKYGYHAAAVHGVSRRLWNVSPQLMCVPSFNSGVLFLRRTRLAQAAMRHWQRNYPGYGIDEVLLTQSLLHKRVPTYCLPCEWNYRGRGLSDWRTIRIVHGRTSFTPAKD